MPSFDLSLAQLRACAEPTRLRLLLVLREAELTVSELTEIIGQSQPGVSRHLRVLLEAGLIDRHPEGALAFYAARRDLPLDNVLASIEGEAVKADKASLAAIKERRHEAAMRYFSVHAEQWDALRRLHMPEAEMERAILDLVRTGKTPFGRLVDLGTGTGRMLVLLDGLYGEAIGYDVSAEMLAVARTRIDEAGARRARVRRGDLLGLPADGDADLVLLHQVLHFLTDPGAAVGKAAQQIMPGGRMLIADFAPHDREELRERHAHRRLGFRTREIERWGTAAGLSMVEERSFPPPDPGGITAKLWLLVKPHSSSSTQSEAKHAA